MMTDEKNEIPRIEPTGEKLPINKDTLDIIVANIIPSSKYFEARFDHLEHRVIRIESEMKDFRSDMDRRFDDAKQDTNNRFEQVDRRFDEMKEDTNNRFEQVDRRFDEMKEDTNNRFEQVDRRFDEMKEDNNRRFEQVDKRFEQVDNRFEQMIQSIDRLSDNLQDRDKEQRGFTMRMFSISIFVSFLGVLGVALKLFGVS
ncbi:MAG: hypothetical protein U9R29_04600 [Thermodesulfobacteriota bacterium]|nr:hypothetical protein [Thermodesulfobacteriota bacterium]